jgi:uncharacterized protein (DUF488 family)
MSSNIRLLYRQKILLALLECFKGHVDKTDFIKLMFLFCQKYKKSFYSFFPHHYGCFSFEIYKDQRNLINKGILGNVDSFSIDKPTGMLYQLKNEDKANLITFANHHQNLRGDELIRRTYLDYPEYAKCSEIKERILRKEDKLKLYFQESLLEHDKNLFTIGYEGISIDEYLNRLIKDDIEILIDVRDNPNSMKFDFNKKALINVLDKVNIQYIGLPELGIPKNMRCDLDSMASYNALFNRYEQDILPERLEHVEKIVDLLKANKRLALTCFEKDHNQCHRYRVAKYIEQKYGYSIFNL